ncbi:hypothetical protein [Microbulbifer marinus]|uniref:Uncharacterized protein n=1 Tax=Microbulbifer marinus TaxID=658218 RepID=A0A1H4ALX7_9GAMM|nr:hypothetical protein [Microbulbifer marinus]SEA36788.1 hypothetical protein SAMN05216562_2865 [Microbulbifer marinus]
MDFLSRQSLARLGLEDEIKLLDTIANLHKHWSELRASSPAESVLDYLASFDDNLEQQRALLESLDIDPSLLQQLGRKLRKAYADEVPESLRKLLRRLDSFAETEDARDPGLVRWKLYEDKADRELVSADALTFALQGPGLAQIDLEAGDLPPAPVATVENLLRIGFAGQLDGRGAAGASAVAFGAEAGTEGRLDYWFAAPGESLFASAAAAGLRKLPSPFSLEAIGDAAEHGLQGLQLSLATSGKAAVSVEYSIFDGSDLIDITAGIEITASYDATREFELSTWCDPQHSEQITVQIKRTRGRQINSSVGLGVTVDMVGAVEQVRAKVIEPYLGSYESFYEKFKPYLSPGTLLEQKCNEALSQAAARLSEDAHIQSALRLALGQDVDADQLQAEISAKLVGWFNGGVGIYSRAMSADLPQGAAARLNDSLPAELPQAVRNKIGTEVGGLIKSLQEKLTEEIQQRADVASGALVGELNELNQRVKEAIAGASEPLDKAVAGVREALAEIDERIHSIVSKLEQAATRKIKLRILSTEKLLREREVVMRLSFDRHSASARVFYSTLVEGNLDALEDLMLSPPSGVEIVEGSARELLGHHYSTGTESSVLGVSLGASSIVDSSVQIQKDAAGNVAIQSRLEVKRILDGIREMQSAGFVSHLNLNLLQRSRTLPLNLTVTQEDERLELDELDDFLSGLTDSGLLSPMARENALALYHEWQRDTGKRYIDARVEVLLQIDGERLENLLDYAGSREEIAMIADVLAALQRYRVFSESVIDRACSSVRSCASNYRSYREPAELFAAFNAGMRSGDRPLKGRRAFFAEPFADTHHHPAVSSVESRGLRNARAIHFHAKSWVLLMRKLHEVYQMAPGAADAEQMVRHNELMAFCLHKWLKVKQLFLFQPNDEVSAKTIAFMGLLAEAANSLSDYPLTVVMDLAGDDSEPRLFS